MMIKALLIATSLFSLTFSSLTIATPADDEHFTLYLTRHAEKQSDAKDPDLTSCGRLRAFHLATTLKEAGLERIYSTSYTRTLNTASPAANQLKLPVKQYSPRGLGQLARELLSNKQNALIVGHSNTTPALLSEITGQKFEKIDESEFQMLFQVQIIADKKLVTVLRQPLTCR